MAFPACAAPAPAAPLDVICGQVAGVAATTLPLKLERGARVAFIGNGLFERMQEHGWFEAMVLQRFAKEELVLRTLAWPGDELTVQPRPEAFGDLHQHLAAQKADVIFAAYGFNESFRGAEALPQFERDLAQFIVGLKLRRFNGKTPPQVVLAVEHYNRMVRLLDHNQPVKVELNVSVKFNEETADRPTGFNIVGDIPGTDPVLPNEIVLLGAHFDSWDGATGATDNATGSTEMMEALRIIKATGLKPRRTIRLALWGAEEGGLIGSRTYVSEHLGTKDAPKPEHGKLSAYFNLDNGTGPIRGVWLQQNMAVKPIFEAWAAPLKDMGVTIMGPRNVASTDHSSFDTVGIPAFQFVQERYEYNSRTHHTNMDFLDRVQMGDVKQAATVVAVFAPRHWSVITSSGTYCVAPLAENVKPKRLFTGTTALSWKPGVILRYGSRKVGPGVRR